MKLHLLFFLIVITRISGYTQNEKWIVKAGENPKEALGDSVIYKYPQFETGTVYFKDGTVSNARLNLNLFTGEMQFIQLAGDTMALANEGLTKYIIIQKDTFYYSKVFVQSVYSNPMARLGKIEMIKPVFVNKETAYGQSSSTSAITTGSYYNDNSYLQKLTQAKEVVFYKKTYYFIGDRFGNFQPALKKNIVEMFNTNESAIDAFMKNNKLKLDKEEDLLRLIDFISKVQN